ncbi:MAG: hypothetical protein JNM80_02185 [Phycisphaerae bacterium]|nr:hypothetical protein [Phycisphaerae bacterium]
MPAPSWVRDATGTPVGLLACVGLILTCAAPRSSVAQPPPGATPIEPGRGDANPQAAGGRNVPTDLRQPTGFSTVYRLQTEDAAVFLRIDGGMKAVFPRSVYTSSGGGGLVPSIPPGTVFYPGELPASMRPSPRPRQRPEYAIDTSLAPPTFGADDGRPLSIGAPRTSWTDETVRVRRVAALLDLAATIDAPRPPPSDER